jgi:hypothetical protein
LASWGLNLKPRSSTEYVEQRLDMTKVNKRWLDKYKKEQGLK